MKTHRLAIWWLVVLVVMVIIIGKLPQRLIYRQKAANLDCQFEIKTDVIGNLNRSWEYYGQGGEESTPMLQPAYSQIQALQPRQIRIDHVFDFPNLDLRLLEIKRLGAIPFISLSYFPPSISDGLTKAPTSWQNWSNLVYQTAETVKNHFGSDTIYYEVWNEPDLFGTFSANDYFKLYQATVDGLKLCRDCKFKVGGPAITTMKADWMNLFLNQVAENNTRLDFVSWHSYQKKPTKTVDERERLVLLTGFQRLASQPELIISEWGIVPEISYLNDGLESANHTITMVSLMNDLVSKMFAFELKDGQDPQGKQFWGRWGLLTHQNSSVQPKPRYYAFNLLNKLGSYRTATQNPQNNIYSLTTIDYPSDITLVTTNPDNLCQSLNITINELANGSYKLLVYSLDNLHDPNVATQETLVVNNRTVKYHLPTTVNGVYLAMLRRTTAGSFKGQGRSGNATDFSARLSQNAPTVDYPILSPNSINQLNLNFWYKPDSEDVNAPDGFYEIVKSANEKGFRLGIERSDNSLYLTAIESLLQGHGEKHRLKLEKADTIGWHNYQFVFNNKAKTLSIVLDNKIATSAYENDWSIELTKLIYFGGEQGISGGYLDDLSIGLDNVTITDNFDQIS